MLGVCHNISVEVFDSVGIKYCLVSILYKYVFEVLINEIVNQWSIFETFQVTLLALLIAPQINKEFNEIWSTFNKVR